MGLLLGAVPARSQSLDEARALHRAGDATAALAAYRAVAARTLDDDPASAGIALNNACVLLIDMGDYPAAHEACVAALPLRRAHGEARGIARALNNLGLAAQHLGRYDEAVTATHEALSLNRARDDAEGEAVNLSNLASIAILAGRYGDALARVAEVVALADRHDDAPWAAAQRSLARINQGVVLERLGAYREALDTYRQLLSDDSGLSPRHRAALRVNTGTLYRNLGDATEAVEQLAEAVTLWQELGDTAALANAKLNLGLTLHRNLDRPIEAEAAYREARALAETSGDRSEEMMVLIHWSDLMIEAGRLDEATSSYQRCLDLAEVSGSARGRWSALDGLARIDIRRGHNDQAIERLHDAIAVIEGVRAGVDRQALRARYFLGQRDVYGRATALLADRARAQPTSSAIADAFGLVQRAKVRELTETLGDRGRLTSPVRLADVQASLDGTAVLLSFYQADGRLLRWTVTRTTAHLDDLGDVTKTSAAVVALHRRLEAGDALEPGGLDRLSTLVPAELDPRTTRIYVAPDGLLHYLPFELLLPATAPPLVYVPSASALVNSPALSATQRHRLVGFADPSLPPAGDAIPTPLGLFASRLSSLPPLAQAAAELRDAATEIGGSHWIAVGADATEAAFRRWAPTGHIIHLATHTVVDERGANQAAVLLGAGDGHDGLLSPDEISRLRLPAALVVLAACRTALGPDQDARGMSSLTGAFLAAGARTVVATLWDVGDQATAVFMQQLYHELHRGVDPAQAVHRVKERLRADPRWSNPSLWAGYVVIGEAAPVIATRGSRTWLTVASIVALIVGLVAVFLARFGRRRATGRPSSRR